MSVYKKDLNKLSRIAEHMPQIMQNTLKKRITVDKDGKKVIQSIPTQIAINHKRQMKKLLKKHGREGVMSYMEAVRKYVELPKQEDKNIES